MEFRTNDVVGWREDICHRLLRLDFEPQDEVPFQGSIKPILDGDGVKVIQWGYTAGRLSRNSNLVKDGTDSFAFLFPVKASAFIKHRGFDVKVKAGEALLMRNNEPGSVDTVGVSQFLGVMVEPSVLGGTNSKFDNVLGQRWRSSKNLSLVRSYLNWIRDNSNVLTAETSGIVAQQLAALLRLLADTVPSSSHPGDSHLAGARFKLAIHYIDQNFHDADLTELDVATAQGVSVRYLQKIFEQEGTTFLACLTCKRMQSARLILQSSGNGQALIDVALSSGYNDLSNFYRMFKRTYGETPSEMRQQWIRGKCEPVNGIAAT
jgi:AraC-like DNA-binding protein